MSQIESCAGVSVPVLPDHLAQGLCVVFCGTAVGTTSAGRGHYYCGRGNEFWPLLFQSGLIPERLRCEDDLRLLEFGHGLTDLNKTVAKSSDRKEAGNRRHAPSTMAATSDWGNSLGRSNARASSSSRVRARRTAISDGLRVERADSNRFANSRTWLDVCDVAEQAVLARAVSHT